MSRPRPFVLTLWAIAVLTLPARSQIDPQQPPLPIDAPTRDAVIDKTVGILVDNYVFADVGEKMRDAVRARQKNKEYDDVKTGQELAKLLTEHLQAVSKDKHLRVACSTKPLPPQPKDAPSKESRAKRRESMKKTNAGFREVKRLPGNVGYLRLDGFTDPEAAAGPAAAAMTFLQNTDALLLDLRYNGGGSPMTVALVCSYLFAADKPVHLNSLYFRKGDRTEEFWTLKDLAGPRYLEKDVYVLTSKYTFSGAEECAYNLQNLKRAVIVGETTGGGAHPGSGFVFSDHFMMFVPTGRAINPISKTNWEGTGVVPEVKTPAAQALDVAHKLAVDRFLERADEETRRQIQADLDRDKMLQKRVQ